MAALKQSSGGEQDMDSKSLQCMVAELGRKVQAAQTRVIATIEAKHAELIKESVQMGSVRSSVATLRGDLQKVAALLGRPEQAGDGGEHGAGSAESPVAALQAAVAEHTALKAELKALDAVVFVLNTLLEVQGQFETLDALTCSGRFTEAAQLANQVSQTLQTVSAPEASSEPAMVRATKSQYYQRRAALVSRVETALGQLAGFGENCATSQQSVCLQGEAASTTTTVRHVWEALDVLGLRSGRAEQLAQQATKVLLRPLLDTARRLPDRHRLEPRLADGRWSWEEVVDEEEIDDILADCEAWGDFGEEAEEAATAPSTQQQVASNALRPPVKAVLPAIESLLGFAHGAWAGGLQEVYRFLGSRLWPTITRGLIGHFDIWGGDDGAALELFEATMVEKGFVQQKEATLRTHVQKLQQEQREKRRLEMLGQARQWLLDDTDQPAHGVFQKGNSRLQTDGGIVIPEAVGEKVRQTLQELVQKEQELVQLPPMRVTSAAHQFASSMSKLMDEAVALGTHNRVEAVEDLGRLVGELATLFGVLRPYTQKAQIVISPQSCATLLADCLYLAHILLMLPFTHGEHLPGVLQHVALFGDLVSSLRNLGERYFLGMMLHQQEEIRSALEPCDFSGGISRERAIVAAEAALGAAFARVKAAARAMSGPLPVEKHRQATALLMGVICQSLLGKMWQLKAANPEEVSSISRLLGDAVAMSRPVPASAGLDGDGTAFDFDKEVPGWSKLVVVADMFGSDFSRFLQHRASVVKALDRAEACHVMRLSWRDESLTPEEAWEVLKGSGA